MAPPLSKYHKGRPPHGGGTVLGHVCVCPQPQLCPPPRIFGFVAKKAGGPGGNACHLFAELDPEQPASAIVTFITKVMLGTHRK